MDDFMDGFLKEKLQAMHGATVRRAMALIKPAAARREECLSHLETAIVDLEYINAQERKPPFKDTKRAVKRLADALVRVEHALKNKDLPWDVHKFFPHAETSEWRTKMKQAAAAKAPVKLSRKAAAVNATVKPSRKAAAAKHRAVRAALSLMYYSSVPDTAKGRCFCELAALLYGERNANLVKQCKAARLGQIPKWGWK